MTEGNDLGEGRPATVKSALWLADYIGSIMTAGAGRHSPFPLHRNQWRGGGGGGFLQIDQDNRVTNYPVWSKYSYAGQIENGL